MTGTELATQSVSIVRFPIADSAEQRLALCPMSRIEEHASWDVLAQLRVRMRAGITVSRFRVQDLLTLKPGQVFGSGCPSTDDVPLMVGSVQIGWSEFEVQDQRMALRMTRLC